MITNIIIIIIIIFILKVGSHTRKTFGRFTTKTAQLETSHVIRKVPQSDPLTLQGITIKHPTLSYTATAKYIIITIRQLC